MSAAIEFEGVWKRYLGIRKYDPWSVVKALMGRYGSDEDQFWALRDVSFTVKPGDALGIIGPNGAGKTTILKILARITAPTRGRVRTQGRVGALINLRAGFHRELTGRENIYLNGVILGMSRREVARKFDEIVEFAGLGEFIDTPVKFYSSGMLVRLGFSIAAHMEPDILLIDEVLSVGDMAFRKRCIERMDSMIGSGIPVVFVSHDMVALQGVCKRAILLDKGRIRAEGSSWQVVEEYRKLISAGDIRPEEAQIPEARARGSPEIVSVRVMDMKGNERSSFDLMEPIKVVAKLRVLEPIDEPAFAVTIYRADGFYCGGTNSVVSGMVWPRLEPGEACLEVTLDRIQVVPGYYTIAILVVDKRLRADFAKGYSPFFYVRGRWMFGDERDGIFVPMVTWNRLENRA